MIRIVLADDHVVMRNGLKLLLERQPNFAVAGEAVNGREAVEICEKLKPDVLVLDIAIPNLNGIEAPRQISAKLPQIAIVILSIPSHETSQLPPFKPAPPPPFPKNP